MDGLLLYQNVADSAQIFRISMYFELGHQAAGDPKYRSNHERSSRGINSM